MPAAVIPQQDGSVYVPVRRAELVPAPREDHTETQPMVVPVLVEELEVQKRVVETGTVRLTRWSTSGKRSSMSRCFVRGRGRMCPSSGWWMHPYPCGKSTAP